MEEIKPSNEIETRNYLEIFLYGVPQENHEAIVQNLKQFVPFFKKHEVGIEYYQLANEGAEGVIVDSAKETGLEGMESIAKTLSAAEDEDIWMELQYFRNHKHCQDVYAMMMQDKNLKILGDEFFGLVTHGKSLVTGGFGPVRQ